MKQHMLILFDSLSWVLSIVDHIEIFVEFTKIRLNLAQTSIQQKKFEKNATVLLEIKLNI